MADNPALLVDFQHLSVVRGERCVLRDFSLRIARGEHIAILGPNGSGKSTLIKAITRQVYPIQRPGLRFRLMGFNDWDLGELREHLGIVELDPLNNLSHEVTQRQVTVREMVLSGFFNSIGLWPHHEVTRAQSRRALEVMRFLEIDHMATRPLSAMSSGEQRRAMIGRALVHDPEALILDEPTNSLDPGAVREFRALMRKLARAGRSLLLVTHHIADVIPEVERVVLMKDGRIEADGSKEKLLTSARLSRLFGVRLRVVRHGRNYSILPP